MAAYPNNNQPSNSPKNPEASLFSQLLREIEVSEISTQNTFETAEKIFNYFRNIALDDDEFFAGKIPLSNTDQELDLHIKIINGLVKIARDSNIGAYKTLSSQLVAEYDKIPADPKDLQMMTLAKVSGGSELLKTLCGIVMTEFTARTPTGNVSEVNAKPLGAAKNLEPEKF